jgi:hypothetical protein
MAGPGRPKKYTDAEDMQVKIDAYFDSCYQYMDEKDSEGKVNKVKVQIRPLTITGLALALDMDRDSLLNYQEDPNFFGTIKKAKMRIHNFAEEQLFTNRNAAGVIFNLKNNYGWKDKNETELTGKDGGAIEINVNIVEE